MIGKLIYVIGTLVDQHSAWER